MKMYNSGPIIAGIVIFLGLVTFPFWYGSGKAAYTPPELVYPDPVKYGKECVLPKNEMKAAHMQLLNDWRDWVVRDDQRIYVAANGKQFNMSLQNTCMTCHEDKEKFCDRCHTALSVDPYCWTCHIEPKSKGAK